MKKFLELLFYVAVILIVVYGIYRLLLWMVAAG